MKSIVPYLTFDGNCEEAFNFYKSILGGKFKVLKHFNEWETGMQDTLGDFGNKVKHITLASDNIIIMGGDKDSQWASDQPQGNSISLSVRTESKEEADRIFNGLSEDGKILNPIKSVEWGEYFGILIDKYGISWIISFPYSC